MVKSLVPQVMRVVCVLAGIGGVLYAQGTRSTQPSAGSSLDDLLAEVRGLRAEIALASSASI
jgi:ribose/xylose/arabinose/galactoside ABC-type transport system permease subunit